MNVCEGHVLCLCLSLAASRNWGASGVEARAARITKEIDQWLTI